ncbi:MAG: stage III sporulation protein AA [Lachnospiraceae bacterium]|nr:stage III sporulation protein AA [Lachnospiraceae bacterium]
MDTVARILSVKLRGMLRGCEVDEKKLQELRLRVGAPVILVIAGVEWYLTEKGKLTTQLSEAYRVDKNEVKETMEYISNYSLYAFEEEVRQGFLTLSGGHRVGLGGRVLSENGHIRGMKYISFLNIRFAHQIKGCADSVLPYIMQEKKIMHTLIVSPPGGGKTTLLRDLVRQLSNRGYTIGVVDERAEIAACYLGVPQNDVGIRTDVLDCCPKAEGMQMLIRSMAPQILAVDEIGQEADVQAVHYAIGCGCKLIATVHAASYEELEAKPLWRELLQAQIFERYILLEKRNGIGKVREIRDSKGIVIC